MCVVFLVVRQKNLHRCSGSGVYEKSQSHFIRRRRSQKRSKKIFRHDSSCRRSGRSNHRGRSGRFTKARMQSERGFPNPRLPQRGNRNRSRPAQLLSRDGAARHTGIGKSPLRFRRRYYEFEHPTRLIRRRYYEFEHPTRLIRRRYYEFECPTRLIRRRYYRVEDS